MSDLQTSVSFEELLNESLLEVRSGEVVKGKVIDVSPSEVIVNIGYKADGILPKHEYTNNQNVDLTNEVKVGDDIDVLILRVNDKDGVVNLSRKKILMKEGYNAIKEAYQNKETVKGIVAEVVKGGVIVIKNEIPIFIPQSQFDVRFVENLNDYVGKEISFIITEFNERRRKVIGNRRVLIQEEYNNRLEEALSRINTGDRVKGVVKTITKYGAFIDLDGIDGLLHISEMSWGNVKTPTDVVNEGQELEVLVKECDKDNKRISLSLKFDETNPWNNAEEKYKVGNIVTGKVARLTDFGAFVEIDNGVDALLHVSQISTKHVKKPSDVLNVGQEVKCKITSLNLEEKKIGLSMKDLEDNKEVTESTEE